MQYKGQEITPMEIKGARQFPGGHRMVVWDEEYPREEIVYAILPPESGTAYPVITPACRYKCCAEIPESPMATYEELSWWLSEGKRQFIDTRVNTIGTDLKFSGINADAEVCDHFRVREKGDPSWHKPTKAFLGIRK